MAERDGGAVTRREVEELLVDLERRLKGEAPATSTSAADCVALTMSRFFSAKAVAERLQVGAISINDASLTGIVNDVEKNSFRFSGMGGSRMGPAGLTRFLRKRALLVQTGEPAPVQLFSDTAQTET